MFQIKELNRFLVRPESGCWEWTGFKDKYGYGKLAVKRRTVYAHRTAFEQRKGKIPIGACVCHTCDNPACINPDHLFAGNHSANMRDMAIKGHTQAKLTPEAVTQIRHALSNGEGLRRLARLYKVSPGTIHAVKTGLIWNHV